MSNNGCGAPAIGTYDDCREAAPVVIKNEQVFSKPYIKLNENFPGIVAGFMYDRENAANLSKMGQTIMRRARSLSPGERELIFAHTSKLNECEFCYTSHTACACEFLDPVTVAGVIQRGDTSELSPKMRALLPVASAVQALNRAELPHAIAEAKLAGAIDQEVHDTVLVASFACMCNRYVDGLGTTFKPGEPEEGGKSLATYGYTMGIKRLFREVLPKLWASFRGR